MEKAKESARNGWRGWKIADDVNSASLLSCPSFPYPLRYSRGLTFIALKKQESGVALIISLFVLFLSSVLIVAFLGSLTTDLQITKNQVSALEATYIAEAGVEDALYELKQDSSWNAGFTNKTFPDDSGSIYTVTISGYPEITITSTATLASGYQHTVTATVEIQ